jgi:NAD(P)-dependent dehydrogenase (short-subunit alcohol dehydrogenase family)
MKIEGQIALVTGAGSGLGEATARRLAGQGARVAVVDRDTEAAERVAAEIGGVATPADVTDIGAVEAPSPRRRRHSARRRGSSSAAPASAPRRGSCRATAASRSTPSSARSGST